MQNKIFNKFLLNIKFKINLILQILEYLITTGPLPAVTDRVLCV